MKNYVSKKEKYFCKYADAISGVFRKVRYGIASCCPKEDLDLITMRYELAMWQSSSDFSSISELETFYPNLVPYLIKDDAMCFVNINVVKGAGESFKIDPAVATWVINHNLLFTPNVTTTDLLGQEIQGTVQYINSSTINVVFSTPVSGWAYLS